MLDLQQMLMPQLKERKAPDGTATLQALAGLVAGGAKAPALPQGTAVRGASAPSRPSDKQAALQIMNDPKATPAQKEWAASIMAVGESNVSNEQRALEILQNPESSEEEKGWAKSVMAAKEGSGVPAEALAFKKEQYAAEQESLNAAAAEEARIAKVVDDKIAATPALETHRAALIASERAQSPHPDVIKRGTDALSAGGGGKQQAEIRRVRLMRDRNILESQLRADKKTAEEIRKDPEYQRLSRAIEVAALSATGASGVFEKDGQRVNVTTGNEDQIIDYKTEVMDVIKSSTDLTRKSQTRLDGVDRMTHTFKRADEVLKARDESGLAGGLIGQFVQMVGGTNAYLIKKIGTGLQGEELLTALNEMRTKSADGSLGLGNLNQSETDSFINALVSFDPALSDEQQIAEIEYWIQLNQEKTRTKLLEDENTLMTDKELLEAQLGDDKAMDKVSVRTKKSLEQQLDKVNSQLDKIPTYYESIDYDLRRTRQDKEAPLTAPRFTGFKLLDDGHKLMTYEDFSKALDAGEGEGAVDEHTKRQLWNKRTDSGSKVMLLNEATGGVKAVSSQQEYREAFKQGF